MSDVNSQSDESVPIRLDDIYGEIDLRVREATQAAGGWPCQKGCDGCCRRLANSPEVTRAEWGRMREGLLGLPDGVRAGVGVRIQALSSPDRGFITCPFLDDDTGGCLIYAYRPAACRMYGFYVSRQGNQWCQIIQGLDDAGELDGILLGNYDATRNAFSRHFGEVKSITEWYGT